MMSYWSIWAPRWLPWRTPPLPTTMHRLQLPSLLRDRGRPGSGKEARAGARCSSLPCSPKGGARSQDTGLSCCTNTGISRRPAEQDSGLRWFRHQRGWQGPDSRDAERFNNTLKRGTNIRNSLFRVDYCCKMCVRTRSLGCWSSLLSVATWSKGKYAGIRIDE